MSATQTPDVLATHRQPAGEGCGPSALPGGTLSVLVSAASESSAMAAQGQSPAVPGCASRAGGGGPGIRPARTEAQRQRMREAAKTRGEPWSLERIAMVRGWNEAGVGRNEIARRLGISPSTVKAKCSERGLLLAAARLNSVAHADDVLLRHYPTMMPVAEVLALYRDARGDNPSLDAMQKHAGRLKIYRPESYRGGNARRASEVRNLGWTKRRAMLAPQVQALLNEHVSMRAACRRLQVSEKLLQRLKAEGLITPLPPLPRVPKMKPAKVAKPAKPPKPKKLPRSWATPRAEPVQRVKAQTVEEFLANGGRIHVCPVVASAPTTATIPAEAREVVRQYHDLRRDADTGNWKQRKNAALRIREAWMVKRVVVV